FRSLDLGGRCLGFGSRCLGCSRGRVLATVVLGLGPGELLADPGECRGQRRVDPAFRLLDRVGRRVAARPLAIPAAAPLAALRPLATLGAWLQRGGSDGARLRGTCGASRRFLGLLEAEAEAMPLGVEADDPELQLLALVHDVTRVGDALVRELADVD